MCLHNVSILFSITSPFPCSYGYMHIFKTNKLMFALYIIVVCVCMFFSLFFKKKVHLPSRMFTSLSLPLSILLFKASALEFNGFEDNMRWSVRNNNKYGNFQKQKDDDDDEENGKEKKRTNRWINAFIFNRISIFLHCSALVHCHFKLLPQELCTHKSLDN